MSSPNSKLDAVQTLDDHQHFPHEPLVTFLSAKEATANHATQFETLSSTDKVCHGRVTDPEAHVSPSWWTSVFSDNLYLQTDGDVVEDPAITEEEVRLLDQCPEVAEVLSRGASSEQVHESLQQSNDTTPVMTTSTTRVLDLCCGQGRHLLLLAQLYPHLELHGHDQSKYLIELARSRADLQATTQSFLTSAALRHEAQGAVNSIDPSSLQANGRRNKVQFTVGDCRTVPHPDASFDLILVMGNSFGYFAKDDENTALLQEIARLLRPGGCLILDIPDGAHLRESFSPRGWEWVDDTMLVCRERQLSQDKKRLISREVVILTDKGVIRDQFYQERLYDYGEVQTLLRDVGLVPKGAPSQQASTAEVIITTGKDMSKRGEDLGMMEQRTFVVAVKPCE
ncbi:hypothetical protein BGZ94_002638 [Podila epigama]|nr:hypothetical protein BGZ94_002638 [Podila epigama]